MHRISCPWCGLRDEAEFHYQGDATRPRPPDDAPIEAFYDFVYTRANPKGWHVEWWHHTGGCRLYLKVLRHTVSHEIRAVVSAEEPLEVPKA